MAVAAAAIVTAALAGCTGLEPGAISNGQLTALQTQAQSCPANAADAEFVGNDVSPSGNAPTVTAAREAELKRIVTRAATCGGYLHVTAFTGSVAASKVVFDGRLQAPGATLNAQLRKVPGIVSATMATIDDGMSGARKSLPKSGSDIVGQFGLAREYFAAFARQHQRIMPVFELMTDGEQTAGVRWTGTISSSTAKALAAKAAKTVTPPPSNAIVEIAGIGKTAGATAASTAYVDGVTAFWVAFCEAEHLTSCSVDVDYVGGV